MNKNFNKLLLFLDSIQFRFSVIAVVETWTTSTTEHLYKIPGYICCIKSRADGRGGGVALYVQDSLCYRPRDDLNVFECADFEFVCVQLNVNCSLCNITVVYRPSGGALSSFNENYNRLVDKLAAEKQQCLTTGDFNINLLNYSKHAETENFLNTALSHFQYPVILRHTRYSSTSSTLLDNIFSNNITSDYLSEIFTTDISYHLPVFYILKEFTDKIRHEYITVRFRDTSYTKTNDFVWKLQ